MQVFASMLEDQLMDASVLRRGRGPARVELVFASSKTPSVTRPSSITFEYNVSGEQVRCS